MNPDTTTHLAPPRHQPGDNPAYEAFHAPRYAYLIRLLEELRVIGPGTRVLDIGVSTLTELIRNRFHVRVDTLGFSPDQRTDRGDNYQFDLNRSQDEATWRRDMQPYDVVVMAEVIEHLYTAPELVLAFLRTVIAPGGTLVLQTPNAAAAARRVKLLLGKNPYERIRLDNTNPGHFREYTQSELRSILEQAGFDVVRVHLGFYFDARYSHHAAGAARYQPIIGRLKKAAHNLMPPSLRLGMTMVARRRPQL